jgi:hypothetical protein
VALLDQIDILVTEKRRATVIPGRLAALAATHLQRQLTWQTEGIEQRSNRLENAAFPHGVVDDAILLVRRLLIDDAHLVGARLRLRRMELERKRDGNGGNEKQFHRKGLRGPLASNNAIAHLYPLRR